MTQVVGLDTRSGSRWIYLDTGIYGGLMELMTDFSMPFISRRSGKIQLFNLAGPTCDSIDVMGKAWLPEDTEAQDLIYVPNTGAYSTSCSTSFNGFPPPLQRWCFKLAYETLGNPFLITQLINLMSFFNKFNVNLSL